MAWDRETWADHWHSWLAGVSLVAALIGLGAATLFGWLPQATIGALVTGGALVASTVAMAWRAAAPSRPRSAGIILRSGSAALAALAFAVVVRGLWPGPPVASGPLLAPGDAVDLGPASGPTALHVRAHPRGEGRQAAQRIEVHLSIGTGTHLAMNRTHVFQWTDRPRFRPDGSFEPRLGERWEVVDWLDALPAGTTVRWLGSTTAERLALYVTAAPAPAPWPWTAALAVALALVLAWTEGRCVARGINTHAAAGAGFAAALTMTARAGFSALGPIVDLAGALGLAALAGGVVGVAVRAIARRGSTLRGAPPREAARVPESRPPRQ